MDMRQPVHNLLKDKFTVLFFEASTLFDESEQVAASRILHHHKKVLAGLENFKKANDVGVLDFFEQVDFLKDLTFAKVVVHELLLDSLNCYTLAGKFVHS